MEGINANFGWSRRQRRAPFNAPFTMWTASDARDPVGEPQEHSEEPGRGRRGKGHGPHGPGHRHGPHNGPKEGPHDQPHGGPDDGPQGREFGDREPRDRGPRGRGPRGPGRRGPFDGGFGPGGDFGRGRGRGGRGRRGDVRAAVLLLLEAEPMHGYELIQQIGTRSGGTWKPSPGSIYPALAQLEDEGLITIDKVAGRKTAQLTEDGKKYVEEHRADLGSPWDDVSDSVGGDARDLRGLMGLLMGAVGQVAATGTPAQVAAAGELLADTRKAVYRILAEDSTPPGSV